MSPRPAEGIRSFGARPWEVRGKAFDLQLKQPGGTVEILPSDDVDLEGAQHRIGIARAKLESEIERAERKLGNQGFVDKAPPEVVQGERDKLERLRAELESL